MCCERVFSFAHALMQVRREPDQPGQPGGAADGACAACAQDGRHRARPQNHRRRADGGGASTA